jgi:predicted dinucleotide-utilizing enzyme
VGLFVGMGWIGVRIIKLVSSDTVELELRLMSRSLLE